MADREKVIKAIYECLLEEIGDVELYLDNLSINRTVINDYKAMKQKRWEERLKKQ